MNIISKEKKEIKWIGLPTNSAQECQNLEVERQRRLERIKQKQSQLQELICSKLPSRTWCREITKLSSRPAGCLLPPLSSTCPSSLSTPAGRQSLTAASPMTSSSSVGPLSAAPQGKKQILGYQGSVLRLLSNSSYGLWWSWHPCHVQAALCPSPGPSLCSDMSFIP